MMQNVIWEPLHKTRTLWKMAEGRFASVGSVKILFQEQENKNTTQKSERDVRLLGRFLKTKDEDKKVENFQPLSWMNTNSRFISFVCTKDSTEPTASLRILIVSFELHLTKKGYSELKEILSRYTNFCQQALLPGRKQHFKGRLARKKRLVQVWRCWRKQTQRFNQDIGSEGRNSKRHSSRHLTFVEIWWTQ